VESLGIVAGGHQQSSRRVRAHPEVGQELRCSDGQKRLDLLVEHGQLGIECPNPVGQ
jgi:hypothetical protein